MKKELVLDIYHQPYRVEIHQNVHLPQEVPRLLIVSYMPGDRSRGILEVCLRSIKHFTSEPCEIWVIDNHSPLRNSSWLLELPGVNVVLNRTEPLAPRRRSFWHRFSKGHDQSLDGSYANAVALEIGRAVVDPGIRYMMTLHMDTLVCHPGWLSFLKSKIRDKVAAAGVRMDHARVKDGVLHILGMLVDFQILQKLHLSFEPSLPHFDVGDRLTVGLRENGWEVFAARNSLWNPEYLELLEIDSPYRQLQVDRSFDDHGNVFFLHLGRGVNKSIGKQQKGTSPDEWIAFAQRLILHSGFVHNG